MPTRIRNKANKLDHNNGLFTEIINGDKYWYYNCKLHRDNDQPAIEYADGSKIWYRHGQLHRYDGPAVIMADGSKKWYQNDKLHRDGDKPAVYEANGKNEWYQYGKLHRLNGPAIVYTSIGDEHNGWQGFYIHEWWQDGQRHRLDGPAIIHQLSLETCKIWYLRDIIHRYDGPAIVRSSGAHEWYINGLIYKPTHKIIDRDQIWIDHKVY